MEEEQDGADIQRKGDILECNNYRGIKLMCHSVKLWERLMEARLRQITSIDNTQYGFRPGKTTDRAYVHTANSPGKIEDREMNKELHIFFEDFFLSSPRTSGHTT